MANRIKKLIASAAKSHCSSCRLSRYAERKPHSLISKIWRWHSGWCPIRRAYQRELARQQQQDEPGREQG